VKLGPTGSPRAGGQVSWPRSASWGFASEPPAAVQRAAGKNSRRCAVVLARHGLRVSISLWKIAVKAKFPFMRTTQKRIFLFRSGEAQIAVLFAGVGQVDSGGNSLEGYRATVDMKRCGGAFEWGAERVIREVIESKLVGRDGAASLRGGEKMGGVHLQRHPGRPHYVDLQCGWSRSRHIQRIAS